MIIIALHVIIYLYLVVFPAGGSPPDPSVGPITMPPSPMSIPPPMFLALSNPPPSSSTFGSKSTSPATYIHFPSSLTNLLFSLEGEGGGCVREIFWCEGVWLRGGPGYKTQARSSGPEVIVMCRALRGLLGGRTGVVT